MKPILAQECHSCSGEEARVEVAGDFLAARSCVCRTACATCRGQGFVFSRGDDGYDRCAPCSCAALGERLTAFNRARLPAHYLTATLPSFETRRRSQQIREALTRANRFVNEYLAGQRGIVFSGPCGTGKTHLSVSVLRRLTLRRGVSSRFIEFKHLIAELREGFVDPKRAPALMGPLVAVPVLVIDELGKGTQREWEQDVLDELVSRRYNAQRTTLFTTNFRLRETEAGREDLRARIGERIVSRLTQMCDFCEVEGDDYRVLTAQGRR